ncbi:MAG: hypothetical protein FK733_09330 [Asgard group archaeon]|nr:hypothetical protein [Asgard group archaeon]
MKRKIIPIFVIFIFTSAFLMNISHVTPISLNGENYWIILDNFSDFNLTIDDPEVCSSKEINELAFKRCSTETDQSYHDQYTYNLDASFNRTYYNITVDFKYKYDNYWDIGRMEIAFMHRNESVLHEYENVVAMFRMIRYTIDNSTNFYCLQYDGDSLNGFGKGFPTNPPLHGITFIAIQNETTTYRAIKKAVHNELLVHSPVVLQKNQSIDYIKVDYWTSDINGNFNASLTNLNMSLVDPTYTPVITTPEETTPSVNLGYSGIIISLISMNIMIIISLYKRKNKRKK